MKWRSNPKSAAAPFDGSPWNFSHDLNRRTPTSAPVAVALEYNETHEHNGSAPVVSAVGLRKLANVITNQARRYGIPVVHHRRLAASLRESSEGVPVSESLFEDVAHVIVHVDGTRRR